MANVGFKLGSQANANLMLTNPENYNITEGSFYLTSDTHRLYIGALPTKTDKDGIVTPTSTTPKLFPLNEGIETVANINYLPVFTAGTPEELAAIGTFYYVEDGNILCIYGGTKSGNGWIQVNANTDTNVEGLTCTVETSGENIANITVAVKDSSNKILSDEFKIKVGGGLKSSISDDTITIEGDTYKLGLTPDTTGKQYTVGLTSENTDNDTNIVLEAGDGINFTGVGDNGIKINADDTHNISSVKIENGFVPESADKEGFRVVIEENSRKKFETDNFNPAIKYGIDETDTVYFKDGVAKLEAYTAKEIQKILRELNAMHYRGTIGANGSIAQQLTYTQGLGLRIMDSSNQEVNVSIGDMFIVSQSIDNPQKTGASYAAGTILICNSTTGAEGTNGFIQSGDLYLEVIESTLDSDTTYTLSKNQDSNGIVLATKNAGDYGELQILTDDGLTASYDWSQGTADRPIGAITISHGTVNRVDSTAPENKEQISGQKFTIPVISSITTDERGHITNVHIQKYLVSDTLSKVSSVTNTTKSFVDNGTSVGSIGIEVATKTDTGAETVASDYVNIVSDTLKIGTDDTHSNTAGGSTMQYGLSINMVWGEF